MKSFVCDLCLFNISDPSINNFITFSRDLLPAQAYERALTLHPRNNFVLRAKEKTAQYPLYYYFYKNIKIINHAFMTFEELNLMLGLMEEN